MDYISIYEVAKQLNVSHTTIYNKLKNKEIYKDLKPFIKKSGNSKFVSSDGVNLLKKHIAFKEISNDNSDSNNEYKFEDISVSTDFINLQESLMQSLQSQIKQLENEKEDLKKDKEYLKMELENKNRHIETQARLIENNQILLKQEQQKTLLLESRTETKGFFKKLFQK